jgi:multidrug efflux pump
LALRDKPPIAAIFPIIIFPLTILMVQMQSFPQMFLVIGVGPLDLIGVVMALFPTHTPMGFVAILGILALIGMIIHNSVILVDRIDMDLARGLQSPLGRGDRRTTHRPRPIVLTTAAALAMIPIASEVF